MTGMGRVKGGLFGGLVAGLPPVGVPPVGVPPVGRATGWRATGRSATGRRATGRSAAGRSAAGRSAAGGSARRWSAAGRSATGRSATGLWDCICSPGHSDLGPMEPERAGCLPPHSPRPIPRSHCKARWIAGASRWMAVCPPGCCPFRRRKCPGRRRRRNDEFLLGAVPDGAGLGTAGFRA